MRYLSLWALGALCVGLVQATRHQWFSPPIPANLLWIAGWAVIGLLWWQAGKATGWWRRPDADGARTG